MPQAEWLCRENECIQTECNIRSSCASNCAVEIEGLGNNDIRDSIVILLGSKLKARRGRQEGQ